MVEKYFDKRGGRSRETPQEIINTIEILAPKKGRMEVERLTAAVSVAVELFSAQKQEIKPLNK